MKYELTSKTSFLLPRQGRCFVVENPVECSNFSHLIGAKVVIDGIEYAVKGVEIKSHNAPWRKGEDIGLLV